MQNNKKKLKKINIEKPNNNKHSQHNLEKRNDDFWFSDLNIIFRKDRLSEFFPSLDMSLEERLNAIIRFCIYSSVLVYFYNRNYIVFYIPIGAMIITKLVYDYNKNINTENIQNYPDDSLEELELKDERNRIVKINGERCVQPTKNNPFMNVRFTDYKIDPERPKACDISLPKVQEKIEDNFSHNLYQDVSDVFGRNVASRQFYTMPATTIPNDQEAFAKWCYGNMASCKDKNTSWKCLKYEDLRQKREPVEFENTQNNKNKNNKNKKNKN